jgi:hypothetical protein
MLRVCIGLLIAISAVIGVIVVVGVLKRRREEISEF